MEIRCPQCDAVIKTGIEHKVVKCPYCNTNLYFEKNKLLTKESIKPVIDSQVAEKLLYNGTGKKLGVKLEYLPFYRIQKSNQTLFLPGKKTDLIRIKDFTPQGDRITLDIKVTPPEFTADEILKRVGLEGKTKTIGLLYVPFFKAEDDYAVYYVDAVKGIILSNRLTENKRHSRNHYPFTLLSLGVITLVAVFFPSLPFKMISTVLITFILWSYNRGKQNG